MEDHQLNRTITLNLNGKEKTLSVDIRESLLDVLRERLGQTSVKHGCGVGECGACSVLIDGVLTDSCIYLAIWADGKSIRTAEGESKDGEISRIQKAYVDAGAVQCGFCTPGMVMATTAFIEKNKGKKVTREEIRKGHSGNLCRCTGYNSIVNAVEECMTEKE
ncbi:MAG: xanthine dehydrogenase iron sulfur-binding subunit XdhC [Clostridiales bacterium]|nr:xanthine dehydrogenase iron sulfur-binding subunit XdhC [Clostridiales bacterium]